MSKQRESEWTAGHSAGLGIMLGVIVLVVWAGGEAARYFIGEWFVHFVILPVLIVGGGGFIMGIFPGQPQSNEGKNGK